MFDESVFGDEPDFDPASGGLVFGDRTPGALGAAGVTPLAAIVEQFGGRLPELAIEPGLMAAVDQHCAAVRDAVYSYAYGQASLYEALTDYVLGFTDALREMGWEANEGYDFASLRLTAVCYFMREYGVSAAG